MGRLLNEESGTLQHSYQKEEVRLLLESLLRPENVEVATWSSFRQLMSATREYFEPGTCLPPAAARLQGRRTGAKASVATSSINATAKRGGITVRS